MTAAAPVSPAVPATAGETPDPRATYRHCLDERRRALAAIERRDRVLSLARLATFLAGVAIAWLALDRDALSWPWILVPVAVFVALVVRHARTRDERHRLRGAIRFYERGLARLDGRWPGTGPPGEGLVAADHAYAADLDVFGHGSLFDLICDARTRSGERTLAAWLAAPADPAIITARQAAIAELRPRLELREALAGLGGGLRAELDPDRLAAWGRAPTALGAVWIPFVAAALSCATLVTLVLALLPGGGIVPFLVAAGAHSMFLAAMRGRVTRALRGIDRAGRDLAMLRGLVLRLAGERVSASLLAALSGRLVSGSGSAARRIHGLELRLELLDSGRNLLFLPAALLLLWPVQLAWAIDRWRGAHGSEVATWIDAVAQMEALCSLAGHAFEHPADPFPEIAAEGPLFDAGELGHPLLLEERCVRNDVRLDRELCGLIVSGSNMSGKSTLLRAVGLNAVLALAGAPVRARRLAMSSLTVGASIRVEDSLLDGRSRFQAEILRLRALFDLARERPPLLFLLDEILHGTNSHDRRVGSEAVIASLLERGALGLVTTHDLALAEIAELLPGLANVHFEDHLEDGEMRFDYRMRPGVVRKSNALALMRAAGLPL